ncbi:MAG: hypothetical protein EZS28_035630 [Streblomastix strix]|uniref:Uncharacterized protein n=1 Tax=Streblomastix strix TaxID=222440 RepID=A0A5J4UF42_9EUKA|nr:MAG: hypothetical protein EZS28_035630 [Streblomastix strix]
MEPYICMCFRSRDFDKLTKKRVDLNRVKKKPYGEVVEEEEPDLEIVKKIIQQNLLIELLQQISEEKIDINERLIFIQ